MAIRRREVLRALGALGLAAPLQLVTGCRSAPSAARMTPSAGGRRRSPRHLVVFQLRGGVDAILATCAKRPGAVDELVDLPYGAGDILAVFGAWFLMKRLTRRGGDGDETLTGLLTGGAR